MAIISGMSKEKLLVGRSRDLKPRLIRGAVVTLPRATFDQVCSLLLSPEEVLNLVDRRGETKRLR